MKILVVDDEGIVLSSCKRVLEAEGFEVLLAGSADAALPLMEKEPPALLLLDIKMPGHDGIYLMKALKSRELGIPVVVISGYATEEAVKEARLSGARFFLAKPFTPDELMETVRRAIERR